MLRRMATVVAATTALALAGAAPALAEHVDFDDPYEFDDNHAGTCAAFGLTPPPAATGWDETGKVDPPVNVDNAFVTATVSGDDGEGAPTHLEVVAKDGFVITAVLVKGGEGGGGTAYFHAPFEDMTANVKDGKPQGISHYVICGEIEEEETTPPPPPPDGNGDDDDDNGDNGDDKETPKPTVPTEVPAGYGDADNGSASTIGLLAFLTAMAIGGGALVTRRFVKDN